MPPGCGLGTTGGPLPIARLGPTFTGPSPPSPQQSAPMKRFLLGTIPVIALATYAAGTLAAQTRGVVHGQRPARLVIHNATVVDGNGTPAHGPFDIVIEGNRIKEVIPLDAVSRREDRTAGAPGDAVIDATGKYVLPGLINAHGHVQDERAGIPQPQQYELNIWLASGFTT